MDRPTITLEGGGYRVDLTHVRNFVEGARVHTIVRTSISGRHDEDAETDLEWTAQAADELDAIARGDANKAFLGSIEDDFELRFERKAGDRFHVVVIPKVVEFDVNREQITAFADAFRTNFVKTSAQ